MTESEYLLADIILLKIPINTEINFIGVQRNALLNQSDNFNPDTLAEMNKIITSESSAIQDFLLREKYINTIPPGIKHILSDKGEKAQIKGGHKPYLEYLKKQNRKNFITDIPKTYWYILTPLAFLFGLFIDFFKDNLKSTTLQKPLQDTTQLYKTIEILQDSVQYLLHQPKETLYIQKNVLSQSKIEKIK